MRQPLVGLAVRVARRRARGLPQIAPAAGVRRLRVGRLLFHQPARRRRQHARARTGRASSARLLRSMGAVCLVATPWKQGTPTALYALAVIFEQMTRRVGGGGDGSDDGAMPPPRRALTNTPGRRRGARRRADAGDAGAPGGVPRARRVAGRLQRIADVYAAVDMQQASASVEADRQMIFGLVSSGVGFDTRRQDPRPPPRQTPLARRRRRRRRGRCVYCSTAAPPPSCDRTSCTRPSGR